VSRRSAVGAAAAVVTGLVVLAGLAVGYAYFTAARALRVNHVAVGPTPTGATDVTFEGTDGATLAGWWMPAAVCQAPPCAAPGSAVVLVHGLNSSREVMRERMRMYHDAGFAVLAYDQRGQGDSTGSNTAGQAEQVDARRAVAFAATRPGVDDRRIGLDGLSFGGMVSVLAAVGDDQIGAVVVESPAASGVALAGGGWPARLGLRLHGIDPTHLDAVAAAPDLVPRPVMVVVGLTEPPATARAIAAGSGGALWLAPGGHTEAPATDPTGYRHRVVGFLARALRSGG